MCSENKSLAPVWVLLCFVSTVGVSVLLSMCSENNSDQYGFRGVFFGVGEC